MRPVARPSPPLAGALAKLGIFVVKNGELESFDRSVGLHGPGWVAEVLRKNLGDLTDARGFVQKVASSWSAGKS